MPLLEGQHLRKSYGSTVAVDDVTVTVDAGEILGLLGPNGAGKTTTMMMLAGLLEPDAGSVRIDGTSYATGGRELRRALGIVPQDLAVYAELTTEENLAFFGRLYGVTGSRLHERTEAVLDLTGLAPNRSALVATFSGGMKRRLNLGVALMHDPKALILDEPTVGVDPQSRAHLLERIRQLSREGLGVLYASHYMEEVQSLCDRVAVMDRGRIVAADTLDGLLRRVTGRVELRVSGWRPHLADRLDASVEVVHAANGQADLVVAAASSAESANTPPLADLMAALDEEGVRLLTINTREANLERLFLELTGHELRD